MTDSSHKKTQPNGYSHENREHKPYSCTNCGHEQSKSRDYKPKYNSGCHACGKLDHWIADCPFKNEIESKTEPKTSGSAGQDEIKDLN